MYVALSLCCCCSHSDSLSYGETIRMSNEFNKTDIVQVRSGGPKMTVVNVGKDATFGMPTVWCMWFEGTKKQEGSFSPEALQLVPNPEWDNFRQLVLNIARLAIDFAIELDFHREHHGEMGGAQSVPGAASKYQQFQPPLHQ